MLVGHNPVPLYPCSLCIEDGRYKILTCGSDGRRCLRQFAVVTMDLIDGEERLRFGDCVCVLRRALRVRFDSSPHNIRGV